MCIMFTSIVRIVIFAMCFRSVCQFILHRYYCKACRYTQNHKIQPHKWLLPDRIGCSRTDVSLCKYKARCVISANVLWVLCVHTDVSLANSCHSLAVNQVYHLRQILEVAFARTSLPHLKLFHLYLCLMIYTILRIYFLFMWTIDHYEAR